MLLDALQAEHNITLDDPRLSKQITEYLCFYSSKQLP